MTTEKISAYRYQISYIRDKDVISRDRSYGVIVVVGVGQDTGDCRLQSKGQDNQHVKSGEGMLTRRMCNRP